MNKTIEFLGFLLIGLLVVLSTSVPLQAAIPASERAALIALYNATDGDNWENNSRWKGINPEADGFSQIGSEGTWFGITVSNDHVTEINLEDNQLTGGIPPELGNLTNLEYLILRINQLSGSIPPELGNLTNLYYLSLRSNQLSGSIPTGLGNLSNLEYLYLYENQLSGSIPPELGKLTNLYILNLRINKLSGSIPPELGNLTRLYYLSLRSNQLTGGIPPELGNLSNLQDLWLYENRLTGSIPPVLGNLTNLYYLSLSSNQLTGNIPTSLTNLTNLWEINIRHNCLYTNDPELRAWLNNFDPDWESYQCVGEKNPPFGSFDTPIDGSTVCSSIPVTGWALDDTGIDSVKIYREQGKGLVYIGDAVLVEGARPDVAEAYPGYNNNTRAGWGYMMLTNFLPNSGNGAFVIHAIAADVVGKTTTLGTKTIHCNNANAAKPFGAIDTPTQGGTASGAGYINWGWVLTPQPNHIPTDGTTINVYVDGVNIGHPNYNNYRYDIADLFPGYANSNGAVGYFYLDTTTYQNGMHIIQWTATDNAGNTDGIGSRYFSIGNTGEARLTSTAEAESGPQKISSLRIENLMDLPIDHSTPVRIRKGFVKAMEPEEIYPDNEGLIKIEIKELERLEIYLDDLRDEIEIEEKGKDHSKFKIHNSKLCAGFLVIDSELRRLPIGSTFDTETGAFYWQPGPGFIGEYRFVFIEKRREMDMSRKNIIVKIVPKFE